jgi:hypothetical protein
MTPFFAYLCYDPRDPDQRLQDRTTWKLSSNSILIFATMLYLRELGFAIRWEKIAAYADMTAGNEQQDLGIIAETSDVLKETATRRQ